MTTPADIIRTEAAEVGVTEYPRGSNRQKYGAAYGANGVDLAKVASRRRVQFAEVANRWSWTPSKSVGSFAESACW